MPDAFELDRLIRAAAESACPANPSRCIVDATREARLGEAAGGRETLPVRELAGGSDKRLFVLRGVTFEVDARYKATAALSGAGAYALSCKAKDEKSGQDVTITKHPDLLADTDDAVGMLRRLAIVRALAESWAAQNVMRVRDVMCPAAGAVFRDVYVCEEQMGATLDHIIRSKQPLSEEHVQYFFYQVTCALKAAHARGVAHRDLQPTHIHLNQNCEVKVSGWEHARATAAQDGDAVADVALTEYVTTRWYRAPEVLLESGAYGEAVDLWALGCVLAELLQRKALFPGRDYIHQIGLIIAMVGSPTDEELRSVVPLHSAAAKHCLKLRESNPTQRVDWAQALACKPLSPAAADLLDKLLVFDPSQRLSAADVLRHEFLRSCHTEEEEEEEVVERAKAALAASLAKPEGAKSATADAAELHALLLAESCRFDPARQETAATAAAQVAAQAAVADGGQAEDRHSKAPLSPVDAALAAVHAAAAEDGDARAFLQRVVAVIQKQTQRPLVGGEASASVPPSQDASGAPAGGGDLDYIDAESIFAALSPVDAGLPAPVRLLDSRWVLARAEELERCTTDEERRLLALPRRQDLERDHPDAFLSVEALRALPAAEDWAGGVLPIGAVSHAWISPSHPDPLGHQLVRLASLIRKAQQGELARQKHGWNPDNLNDPPYHLLPDRIGLFFDYASLFQKGTDGSPRTVGEQAAFNDALSHMQIWYAHQRVCTFLITTLPQDTDPSVPGYDERGWPTVERTWAQLAKPNSAVCWPMLFDVASETGEARRTAILHPARLAHLLESKRFTSPKADLPLVARLYRETAEAFYSRAVRLHHARSQWAPHEFACFAEVVPLCRRCEVLNLAINSAGCEGATALAAAFAAGAMPCLQNLYFSRNGIGGDGFAALAAALRGGALPQLKLLDVSNNAADAGASSALAEACRAREITFVIQLDLRGARRPLLGANETVRVGGATTEQLEIAPR